MSYKKLLFVYFLYLTMLFFSFITIGRYVYYTVSEYIYTNQHQKHIQEIGNIIQNSDRIINAQYSFDDSLNSILDISGLKSIVRLNSLGGKLVEIPTIIQNKKISREVETQLNEMTEVDSLKQLSVNISNVKSKIQKLAVKMKSFEKVTKYIPSIWPLLGDGRIVSNHHGIITISAVPSTPVVSTAEGKVASISLTKYGMKVVIVHKYQFVSTYNGLYTVAKGLKKGQVIKKSTVIGYVGNDRPREGSLIYGIYVGNEKGLSTLDAENLSYLGR